MAYLDTRRRVHCQTHAGARKRAARDLGRNADQQRALDDGLLNLERLLSSCHVPAAAPGQRLAAGHALLCCVADMRGRLWQQAQALGCLASNAAEPPVVDLAAFGVECEGNGGGTPSAVRTGPTGLQRGRVAAVELVMLRSDRAALASNDVLSPAMDLAAYGMGAERAAHAGQSTCAKHCALWCLMRGRP
jgi:hypothetical protein